MNFARRIELSPNEKVTPTWTWTTALGHSLKCAALLAACRVHEMSREKMSEFMSRTEVVDLLCPPLPSWWSVTKETTT